MTQYPGRYSSARIDEAPCRLSLSYARRRSAASRFFFVCAFTYVPMTKAMKLKNGSQACSGRNCCANASAMGDVIQLTFITGMKPARTVARTW